MLTLSTRYFPRSQKWAPPFGADPVEARETSVRIAPRPRARPSEDSLASDPRAQLALALSSVGAIAPLDLAIAHGAMICDLDAEIAALEARPFAEKLESWGKGPSRSDALDPVTRRSWHTELVHQLCYEAWRLTSLLHGRIPTLTLRDALFAVSKNARRIVIVREGETALQLATLALNHTLQALDGVASILRGLVGGAFDRVTLMNEVARVMAYGHATQGEHPWVTRLAAELAPTPFAAHFARLTEHQRAFERASAMHAAAASAMSFWDRLLPDSALEATAREAKAELEALPEALQSDWREACRHFDRALGVIPGAALGLGLNEAREAVRRIRFESKWVHDGASESVFVRKVVHTTLGHVEANLAIQQWPSTQSHSWADALRWRAPLPRHHAPRRLSLILGKPLILPLIEETAEVGFPVRSWRPWRLGGSNPFFNGLLTS